MVDINVHTAEFTEAADFMLPGLKETFSFMDHGDGIFVRETACHCTSETAASATTKVVIKS
jgi:hypothetical protein